ncbi:MAG: hypothetical protein Kow0042_21420 [Calditrichia bacterium]
MGEFNYKTCYLIIWIFLPLLLLNCDSSTSFEIEQPEGKTSFTDLKVGQEWRYARWEKPYSGDRFFTGDTILISIIDKKDKIVTFYERPLHADSVTVLDTATFCFQIKNSFLRQPGLNNSHVFGFLNNHDGILLLTSIDSNRVTVNIDSSFFLIRQQIGKSRFIGYADSVELFSQKYENVIIYYDETPTYVDGFGHLAIFSLQDGVVATIYFGGYSPIEQFGYQLIP